MSDTERTETPAGESAEAVEVDAVDTVDIDETEKSLADIDASEEADLDEQIRNNTIQNVTLADAEMKMFGDRTVLAQVAQLVAYIRHAVKSGEPTEIKVVVNKSDATVAGAEFMFDLNGCQVPDLVPQPEVFVN